MKISFFRPLVLGLALLLPLSGRAVQSSDRRILPQVVDPPYVFESPLPASRPVSGSWFSDAVFIGDSRLAELLAAELFQPGLSLAQMGLNVRDVRSNVLFSRSGERADLRQMLEGTQFRKVYLMLGFNEAAWMGEQEFYAEYAALIDDLRDILPGVEIYVQTLIPVTVSRAAVQAPGNELLAARSALLARLAQDKQVYLVAVGDSFASPNGALESTLTSDGLHLTAEGNHRWFEYLRTHTMGT